jgi:hypothetical protein
VGRPPAVLLSLELMLRWWLRRPTAEGERKEKVSCVVLTNTRREEGKVRGIDSTSDAQVTVISVLRVGANTANSDGLGGCGWDELILRRCGRDLF